MSDAPGGPDATFAAYLADGRFMLQRSHSSGRYVFYPRLLEPESGNGDLAWVEPSGLGTVYATTVVRRRPEKGGPYNIALIDLDEGVRLMSRIETIDPGDVVIGMRVRAHVAVDRAPAVLVFHPLGHEEG